jgi:hypothetical protein
MIFDFLILTKIVVVFFLIFYVLPKKIFPQDQNASFFDNFFANLTHMTFFTILAIHILVILHIYELISLSLSYLLLYIFFSSYRAGRISRPKFLPISSRLLASFFDFLDGENMIERKIQRWIKRLKLRFLDFVKNIRPFLLNNKYSVMFSLLLFFVTGYSAYLRFYDSFHHKGLGASDPYVLMVMLKHLEINKLFTQGVYPEGFVSFLSCLHHFTFLDPVHLFRFVGPFIGVLIVLSIYFVVYKITRNKGAALIAAFIYGISTTSKSFIYGIADLDQLHSLFYRQSTTLSQEFATLFLMPTLYFLFQYLFSGRRWFLFLFFEGLVVIFRVHSIVVIMTFFGIFAVLGSAVLSRHLSFKRLVSVVKTILLGTAVGNLSILLGILFGQPLHKPSLSMLPFLHSFYSLEPIQTHTLSIYVFIAVGISLLLHTMATMKRSKRRAGYIFAILFMFILLFEFLTESFGLRPLVNTLRAACFLAISFSVLIGLLFHTICTSSLLRRPSSLARDGLNFALTTGVLLIMIIVLPPRPSIAFKMEYESFVKNYLKISRKFPPLDWLIVSQIEEYPLVLGKGWHLNISTFLDKYDPRSPKIGIDTRFIFLFVEKKPFKAIYGATEADYERRWDLERRLLEWCQTYMVYHDNMRVFYEDREVVIYLIDQKEKT